jgi:hypothetical protein
MSTQPHPKKSPDIEDANMRDVLVMFCAAGILSGKISINPAKAIDLAIEAADHYLERRAKSND